MPINRMKEEPEQTIQSNLANAIVFADPDQAPDLSDLQKASLSKVTADLQLELDTKVAKRRLMEDQTERRWDVPLARRESADMAQKVTQSTREARPQDGDDEVTTEQMLQGLQATDQDEEQDSHVKKRKQKSEAPVDAIKWRGNMANVAAFVREYGIKNLKAFIELNSKYFHDNIQLEGKKKFKKGTILRVEREDVTRHVKEIDQYQEN